MKTAIVIVLLSIVHTFSVFAAIKLSSIVKFGSFGKKVEHKTAEVKYQYVKKTKWEMW